MMRLSAAALTVEYDAMGRLDAIVLRPFPSVDPDEGVLVAGTVDDLAGVVDTMQRLVDDLRGES